MLASSSLATSPMEGRTIGSISMSSWKRLDEARTARYTSQRIILAMSL